MKKFMFFLLAIAVAFTTIGCGTNNEIDTKIDMSPRLISMSETLSSTEIADAVKGAIVGVSARLSNGTSIGSGVAIADGGYVLTNQHVINGQRELTLYFADKSTGSAKLVWSDSSIDLAILKSEKNMPYLDTSPLSEVAIGDDVLAVGTPLSLQFQHTFTKGIISALNRTLEIETTNGYTTFMQNLIQHDASINSGNSGGPLINAYGKVIGINSLKASDAEGIGFAIPIETATSVAQRVIQTGAFRQVKLGIFGCDAELAKFKEQTELENGVYVISIQDESLIANTPLKLGDVIISINGKEINDTLDFRKAIYSLNFGETVEVVYFDGESEKTITLIV